VSVHVGESSDDEDEESGELLSTLQCTFCSILMISLLEVILFVFFNLLWVIFGFSFNFHKIGTLRNNVHY